MWGRDYPDAGLPDFEFRDFTVAEFFQFCAENTTTRIFSGDVRRAIKAAENGYLYYAAPDIGPEKSASKCQRKNIARSKSSSSWPWRPP
jgi:hypothetical protein